MGTVLELPPGAYQIRVAALEMGGGRRGSLFLDVEIPDYGAPALSMSPILVASGTESEVPVLATEEDQRSVWALPSTRSTFSRRDELWILTEIYWDGEPSELNVSTTLKSTDGVLVLESMVDGSSGWRHRQRIPLSRVPPGEYLLEVGVETTSGGEEVVRGAVIEVQ
jgi:hypothetical protein